MRKVGILAGAIALVAVSVQGATITSLGPVVLNQPTVGTGTTVGSLGYTFATVGGEGFFFQPGGSPFQVTSLPSWASIHYASPLDYFSGTGYAPIAISGAASNSTGYGYYPTGASSVATAMSLMSVTLGAGAPSSFELGVMEDNTGSVGDNTTVIFNGTDGSSETVNSPPSSVAHEDDFYYVNVTNASPGDVINLTGFNPSGGSAGFGGIVFDPAAPVPEPVTLALLGIPVSLISLGRRRRV